jgi:hypothetical protein
LNGERGATFSMGEGCVESSKLVDGNAHKAALREIASSPGGVVVEEVQPARSREAWLRGARGEARRIGRARGANWDLLEILAARGRVR